MRIAILAVTEQRTKPVGDGKTRTFVGGSKTTAYSSLETPGF
jgi:hypothetical protein